MRDSKTLVTAQPSFSEADRSVNFKAPQSWGELSQNQLRYTLFLIATFPDAVMVKTYMFFRFSGIEVIKKDRYGWMCRAGGRDLTITPEQVESLINQFDYIDSYDDLGVRLDDIDGHHAVDVLLHGVNFGDYLNAEKFYQLYLQSQEEKYIERLATVLYRDENEDVAASLTMDKAETLGTILWFAWVKQQLGKAFPHFFRPAPEGEGVEGYDVVTAMNTQIRALTDGDVTKEQLIAQIDCWRALTELDFKAKEAEEFNKKIKK